MFLEYQESIRSRTKSSPLAAPTPHPTGGQAEQRRDWKLRSMQFEPAEAAAKPQVDGKLGELKIQHDSTYDEQS